MRKLRNNADTYPLRRDRRNSGGSNMRLIIILLAVAAACILLFSCSTSKNIKSTSTAVNKDKSASTVKSSDSASNVSGMDSLTLQQLFEKTDSTVNEFSRFDIDSGVTVITPHDASDYFPPDSVINKTKGRRTIFLPKSKTVHNEKSATNATQVNRFESTASVARHDSTVSRETFDSTQTTTERTVNRKAHTGRIAAGLIVFASIVALVLSLILFPGWPLKIIAWLRKKKKEPDNSA